MGLSQPRTIYGIHSLTLYDRTSLIPYGTLKVLGSLNIALSGGFNDLFGGSSPFPWDSEPGTLDVSLTGNIKEIPDFAFERFLGASVTSNAAEASGNVGALTNHKGTSTMNASTGIASVSAISGSEADLKDGLYVLVVTDAAEVDVYCMSDVDFNKGTDKEFLDDTLKIADGLAITTGGDTNVTGFGFKLTGGSGTIGMTTGHTAYFYVRKVNGGSSIVTVGASTAEFREFGALVTSQKKADGHVFETELFRVKAIGLPLAFNEKAWLGSDVNMKALYDASKNAVYRHRIIKGA